MYCNNKTAWLNNLKYIDTICSDVFVQRKYAFKSNRHVYVDK